MNFYQKILLHVKLQQDLPRQCFVLSTQLGHEMPRIFLLYGSLILVCVKAHGVFCLIQRVSVSSMPEPRPRVLRTTSFINTWARVTQESRAELQPLCITGHYHRIYPTNITSHVAHLVLHPCVSSARMTCLWSSPTCGVPLFWPIVYGISRRYS